MIKEIKIFGMIKELMLWMNDRKIEKRVHA